jgi:hypothetical protein
MKLTFLGEKVMRKVLLASTALFALGSVSAMAADISISGSSEVVLDMGDSATADDSGLAIEHDIAITFSNTTDSGITTTMVYGMDDKIDTTGGADDLQTTISGDFGSFRFTAAGDDHALSAIDIDGGATAEEAFSRSTEAEGQGASSLHEIASIGDQNVTYVLPSIVDGLYVAGSLANGTGANGEAASYGIKYDAGMFAVTYGQLKGQVVTTTHVGVSASMGDFGISLAKNSDDTANEDRAATLMGLTYSMGDITLGYESEQMENGTATDDEKHTAFGATYAIAPGLTASLTMAESDKLDGATDVATTSIGIGVSF